MGSSILVDSIKCDEQLLWTTKLGVVSEREFFVFWFVKKIVERFVFKLDRYFFFNCTTRATHKLVKTRRVKVDHKRACFRFGIILGGDHLKMSIVEFIHSFDFFEFDKIAFRERTFLKIEASHICLFLVGNVANEYITWLFAVDVNNFKNLTKIGKCSTKQTFGISCDKRNVAVVTIFVYFAQRGERLLGEHNARKVVQELKITTKDVVCVGNNRAIRVEL
mmetsp:Transcript_21721/g.32248  ORF Transcript_21721/g.32248 Transcript_21721/m.32248 type:complete len:221 (-) Transcript_21721:304-966(-)